MNRYQADLTRDSRKLAAQSRIQEKVAILAKWESEGIFPKDLKYVPKSKAAFCKWDDSDLTEIASIDGRERKIHGIFSFTEATLDKPFNAALKERAVELITKLNARKTRRGQASEIKKLKALNRELTIALQKITNEFVGSRSRNNELERTVIAQRMEIDRLMDRLRNVVPFGPKGVV